MIPLLVAIELSGSTVAGEGASWFSRFERSGVWMTSSSGSNGAQMVSDTEAGCADPSVLEPLFAKAAEWKLEPEPKQPAPPGRAMRSQRVIVVDKSGKRWLAPEADVAVENLNLPTWYADGTPVFAFHRDGVQATLTRTSVWCHRTSSRLDLEAKVPARPSEKELAKLLGQVLVGIDAKALEGDDSTGVEVALAAGPRAAVRKKALADAAVKRFTAEMTKRRFPCGP